jgi:HEAT repeat protein
LAEELTVDELIDRWNRWPDKSGKESYQSLYAEALGLYGEVAVSAVPDLAPAVKYFEPNLRAKVMHALVSIGEEGIPPLLEALVFKTTEKDPSFVVTHISEDAANSLARAAKNELDLTDAIPTLREFLTDPETSVFARQNVARALIGTSSPESQEALENAREWLYAQNGLSVEENRILKIINIGLRRKK